MKKSPARHILLAAAALSLGSLAAIAQDAQPIDAQPIGAPVLVTLKTGETLRGSFAGIADGKAMIDHPILGRVGVPLTDLSTWSAAPADPATPATTPPPPPGATVQPAPPPDPAKAEAPPPPPPPTNFFQGWTGSVEAGINGSSGNTDRLNLRAGLGAQRKTEETETTFGFVYSYAQDNGNESENRAQIDLRNDWLLGKDSPWRIYALGRAEYDTFQNWDWRVSGTVGVGYQFIKTDKTSLIGRVGIGASRELGGSENRIRPELNLGLDFEHKFTDNQKLFATLDYYPDLGNFSDFRFVGRAGYEILLDPKSGLSLKLGVEDRYDSTPDGGNRNDIDYFALMVFKF